MQFIRRQIPVAINISDYSIEVLQLDKSKEITAYGRTILEEGIVHDGKIIKGEALSDKLRELLKTTRPRKLYPSVETLEVIATVPESKTFLHYFQAPSSLKGDDLERTALTEAAKNIPVSPESIYWDYQAFPAETTAKTTPVLFAAVLKDIANDYIMVLHAARLKLIALDIESAALGKALIPVSQKEAPHRIIADIGARTTTLAVFDDKGALHFSVDVQVAGNDFTKAVADDLGVKLEEAEELKRKFGFKESPDNKIALTIAKSFTSIFQEISNAMRYYEKISAKKVTELVLAGGSSLLPEISQYCAGQLKMRVALGNPLEKISPLSVQKLDKTIPASLFANVIGLALRGIERRPEEAGINFLPKEGYRKIIAARVTQTPEQKTAPEQEEKSIVPKTEQAAPVPVAEHQYGRGERVQNFINSFFFALGFLLIAVAIVFFVIFKYVIVGGGITITPQNQNEKSFQEADKKIQQ